jgi:hypothetical protein
MDPIRQQGSLCVYPQSPATLGPMAAGLQAFVVRVSRLLSEHRLVSFAVTAVTLLLMADSIRRVLPDEEGEGEVVMWAAVAVAAYSAIATVYLVRRGPPETRLFLAWFGGITPALCGMAAALAGSPALVMWVGVLLAIGLVGWIAAATRTA